MFNRDNGFFGLALDAIMLGSAYYCGKKHYEKCSKDVEIERLKRQAEELNKQLNEKKTAFEFKK